MNPAPQAREGAAALALAPRGVLIGVVVLLLGTAFLIDPWAAAAFDAPKALVALVGIAWAWWAGLRSRTVHAQPLNRWQRAILCGLALAAIGVLISTWQAPRPALAWSTLGTLAVWSLLPWIAAGPVLEGETGQRVLQVAVWAVAGNAVVSLLQAAGVPLPLHIAQPGGRFPTGALLGNEGYVALACALLGSACVGALLSPVSPQLRRWAWGLLLLALVTILVNRQLTALIALATAALVLVLVRWRQRLLLVLAGVAVATALVSALVPGLRTQTWAQVPGTNLERYQHWSTHRIAAWGAALHMASARPWTGQGLGSYALEAQPHRQALELEHQVRLLPPLTAHAYAHAHQDYLQLAAEAGVPVLLAVLLSLGVLYAGLLRRCWGAPHPEPLMVLGVLLAGAVAALAWFPMHIPLLAALLLLAAGRAWRGLGAGPR